MALTVPRRRRTLLAGTALAVAALAPQAAHAAPGVERSATTPTSWYSYHGLSPDQVGQIAGQKGSRLVDIEVESSSPYRFTATYVRNTGVHASAWWWYFGLTPAQLSQEVNAHQARILDISPVVTSNGLRLTAILVPNTGAVGKAWKWYYGVKPSQISAALPGYRLIDLDGYQTGAGRRYTAVMIQNAGADAKAWWYYYNVTPSYAMSLASANHARLVDLDARDGNRFDVIMEQNTAKSYWWWYYGKSHAWLTQKALQNGARLIRATPNPAGGFAGIMLQNAPSETLRINELMRAQTQDTGYWGMYLRRVGGATVHAINERRGFEPASMMKALYELRAMRVEEAKHNGFAGLNSQMTWFLGSSAADDPTTADDERADGCPDGTLPTQNTVGFVIQRMMWRSDNRATDAILNRYGGKPAMNALALSLGMNSTHVGHKIGCGSDATAHPNQLTLFDAGLLYQKASDGTALTAAGWAQYRSHTNTGILTTAIVDQEAAKLGLSAAKVSQFKSLMTMEWKPGGYTLCNPDCVHDITIGGHATLPFKVNGVIKSQPYVFGAFTQNVADFNGQGNTLAGNAQKIGRSEIFRTEIRRALKTFK